MLWARSYIPLPPTYVAAVAGSTIVEPWIPADPDDSYLLVATGLTQSATLTLEASNDGSTVSTSTSVTGTGTKTTSSLNGYKYYRAKYVNGGVADPGPFLITIGSVYAPEYEGLLGTDNTWTGTNLFTQGIQIGSSDLTLSKPSSQVARLAGNFQSTFEISARVGAATQVDMGAVGPTGEAALKVGGATWYCDAAVVMRTDNLLRLGHTDRIFQMSGASMTQTTVGAAGGASALPATPLGFAKAKLADGTDVVFPYYQIS